jgi:hypothetical protein
VPSAPTIPQPIIGFSNAKRMHEISSLFTSKGDSFKPQPIIRMHFPEKDLPGKREIYQKT